METKRQKQVAELVKRHMSMVLQQDGAFIYGAQALVTVTSVVISPDLYQAKIYLSIWNVENKQEVMLHLEDNHSRVKQSFAHHIRKHIRRVPDIYFYMDDTIDEMYKVENLFNKLYDEGHMPKDEA